VDDDVGNQQWTVERLVPGGDGLARLSDGRIGFASGTAPGDVIRVHNMQSKKSFARAREHVLVTPGPGRVPPECPHAHACGGCDWMHLSRQTELDAKRDVLAQALQRTGGFHELDTPRELVTAGTPLGYRSRIRLHIGRSGRLGLYAEHSHSIVEIERCLVAGPTLNEGLDQLKRAARQHQALTRSVAEVEIRAADDGSLHFRATPRQRVDPAEAQIAMAAALGPVSLSTVGASSSTDDQVFALTDSTNLHSAPGAFVQVNWPVNRRIVGDILSEVARAGARTFVDLYCGAGNFTLPLLAAKLQGVGVDREGAGLRSARRAAQAQGLDEGAFISGDARDCLELLPAALLPPDVLLLDPPRTGAKEAVDAIARLRARKIAYVSCDPVTLARDAKRLVSHGYRVDLVQAYDMFPRTHHFETVMWLQAT
jgi:23S rRNA (uracil1939-C5)-methyltransferase